jgi:hypothetical protein
VTPPFDVTLLQPGDTLLYRPVGFRWRAPFGWMFGRLIAAKTWHNISHVEVYAGNAWWQQKWQPAVAGLNGQRVAQSFNGRASFASRDGVGVDVYPLRTTELAYVLRPVVCAGNAETFDLRAGLRWFVTVQGQKYDWLGLTRFVKAQGSTKPKDKMFCSAFWLRFMRACGFNPFHTRIDADSIAPGEIPDSPKLEVVWTDEQDHDYTSTPAVAVALAAAALAHA